MGVWRGKGSSVVSLLINRLLIIDLSLLNMIRPSEEEIYRSPVVEHEVLA